MRKSLRGLLVMGAAAAVTLGASSLDAEAASSIPQANVKVNYNTQKLKISGVKDTKFYLATSTVSINKKTDVVTLKTAAATEYDATAVGVIEMDLSSYAVTKDNYISIWGNVNIDPLLIKLPAATTKLKATVNAVESSVKVEDIADKNAPKNLSEKVEYCTGNGSWSDYYVTASKKYVDLTNYAKLGATIRFRVKATTTDVAASTLVNLGNDKDGKAVSAYSAEGNFASNELKAKIAKTAAGPKATIDYNTRTIKIPATSEYRVTTSTTAVFPNAFTASGAEKGTVTLNLADLKDSTIAKNPALDTKKPADFDLRTAATATKPASKITEYKFQQVDTLTAQTSKNAAISSLTQDVTDSKLKDIDIKVTKLTLNSKTMAGTMTFTNNSNEAYQVIVGDVQDGVTTVAKLALPSATDKATGKVAAAKAGKPGVGNIKVKSGQYVYIAKQGDTKATTWSTPYVFFGVVNNTLE